MKSFVGFATGVALARHAKEGAHRENNARLTQQTFRERTLSAGPEPRCSPVAHPLRRRAVRHAAGRTMNRRSLGMVVGMALAAVLALPAAAQTAGAGVEITGQVDRPYVLTEALAETLPVVEVTAADHGAEPTVYRGTPLSAVLEHAGVELGVTLRGARMASYLLVEADDGYRAVFALPELSTLFGHGEVYLVWRANGEPLTEHEGAFRLVVPGETRHARWVRQVRTLRVVQLETAR